MTFSPASVDTMVMLVAVVSTLAILSVVYRENAFYRLFEHLFVGVATGFGIFVTWRDALSENFWQPLSHGSWYVIIPMLVSLLFYTVMIPKYAWMSRFLISILFGLGAGATFRGFATEVFPQVKSSFLSVVPRAATEAGAAVSTGQALNNIVFLGTLICVMVYFFFSFRHDNKIVTKTARTGRWLLMIAFGATFGSTVMARFSLLIDRIRFLLESGTAMGHWFR
ncbi:MAG: hypothetical protein HZB16_03785 [Armatimonadetes bacterium]|nr:hypothetical protein [Armatimonadota bacterium]